MLENVPFPINRRQFCACCAASLGAAFGPQKVSAQDYIQADEIRLCAGEEIVEQPGLWTFESSPQARELVKMICDAVGLAQNFEVRAAAVGDKIGNAAAVVIDPFTSNPKRLIIYNERWVQRYLRESGEAYWSGVALLAHECGHHLNGHTLDNIGSQPPKELEADRFAGFIVGRLGGSLEQAEALFEGMSEAGSATHPARRDRLQAVAVGWQQGAPAARGTPSPGEPAPASDPPIDPAPPAPTPGSTFCASDPFYETVVSEWREGENLMRRVRACGSDGVLYESTLASPDNGFTWIDLLDGVRVP